MKAIPTFYRGIKFRSRIEARWATFFDAIGLDWEYEPQGYNFDGRNYLPDFWLPNALSRSVATGLFFEVKGTKPTDEEEAKARGLAFGSGKPVVIAVNGPREPDNEVIFEYVADARGTWDDDGLMFAKCSDCGAVDIGFYARSERQCRCIFGVLDTYEQTLMTARQEFNERARWRAA